MVNIKHAAIDENALLFVDDKNKFAFCNGFEIQKNSIAITVVAIRLEAVSNSSDFQRNRSFSLAYLNVFANCIQIFNGTNLCLNIEQRSNIILGIFKTSTQKEINQIFTTITSELFNAINALNKPTCEIKFAVFMDSGNSDAVVFVDNSIFINKTLWLGNIIERTLKICKATILKQNISILITHNVYDKLDKAYQNKFLNSYYLFHICCFGNYQLDT